MRFIYFQVIIYKLDIEIFIFRMIRPHFIFMCKWFIVIFKFYNSSRFYYN